MQCLNHDAMVALARRTYTVRSQDGAPETYYESETSHYFDQGLANFFNSPGMNNFCNRDIVAHIRYETGVRPETVLFKANARNVHSTYLYPIIASAEWAN